MEEKPLIARDSLFTSLLDILTSSAENISKSIYVCGKPGTGKTFTVDRVLQEIKRRKIFYRKFSKIIELNGMEITSSADIWKILQKRLEIPKNKSLRSSVLEFFSSLSKPLILVIDEFENLISNFNRSLIVDLFSLPYTYNKLILLSISNLVDLPDILMPELERIGCVPEILVFPPYTKSEIYEIIKEIYGNCSDKVALEVCAAQVEKIGDARRALGICKNSIKNGKISLVNTIKTTNDWNNTVKLLSDLPYMNKMALIICKKICENKMNSMQMHSAYKSICKKEGGEGLPLKEFISMLQNLNSAGIVEFDGQAKDISKKYPKIVVPWEDINRAFKDLPEIMELQSASIPTSWKFSL